MLYEIYTQIHIQILSYLVFFFCQEIAHEACYTDIFAAYCLNHRKDHVRIESYKN